MVRIFLTALAALLLLLGCQSPSAPPEAPPAVSAPGPAVPEVRAVPGPSPAGFARVEGGSTVEEVFRDKDRLAGKQVALRGRVAKVNRDILGRNWVHVQDGTGAEGENDLTVTTTAEAAVGDTVVVRGTLSLDRDFGYGYRYGVILEDASLTVE